MAHRSIRLFMRQPQLLVYPRAYHLFNLPTGSAIPASMVGAETVPLPNDLCVICFSQSSFRMSALWLNSHFLARLERLPALNIWLRRKASGCWWIADYSRA